MQPRLHLALGLWDSVDTVLKSCCSCCTGRCFQPPRSISPPTRLDEASDLYRWADEYLDAHVLDSMEDLFFDEAEQPEAAQGGGAPG